MRYTPYRVVVLASSPTSFRDRLLTTNQLFFSLFTSFPNARPCEGKPNPRE